MGTINAAVAALAGQSAGASTFAALTGSPTANALLAAELAARLPTSAASTLGLNLLNDTSTTEARATLGLTDAVVDLAVVALTGATALTLAGHGNRTCTFSGADATLTIANDATGLWDTGFGNHSVEILTLTGSAGVPTLTTPDGKSIVGSTTKAIGATRKGANSWNVGTTDPNLVASITTTKGDLVARGASSDIRFPVGADGLRLVADSATPSGLNWVATAGGVVLLTGGIFGGTPTSVYSYSAIKGGTP